MDIKPATKWDDSKPDVIGDIKRAKEIMESEHYYIPTEEEIEQIKTQITMALGKMANANRFSLQ